MCTMRKTERILMLEEGNEKHYEVMQKLDWKDSLSI